MNAIASLAVARNPEAPRLQVEGLSIRFGGLAAVQDVSFHVHAGEVLAVIGPNGAGKTTLFNMVSGVYRPDAGHLRLHGEDVNGRRPFELARRGMSRTFQNLQVFFRLTVLENVMIGRARWEKTHVLSDLLMLPSVRRQNAATREAALRCLTRVGLAEDAERIAGNLSYGALKRLEIARALATEPEVLLLDEPAAGCNAVETAEIDRLVRAIADSGTAIVLIEHDMKMVMRISDRILVLDQGRVLATGLPADIRRDPRVVAAYLGTHADEVQTRSTASEANHAAD
ncbi:ABC transporter ATP-binding protein [Chitinasiproducens palmae]|uniref:Amino acid/amide ABC transporter ATP-binding protein 1, HAAT family n=1 Tax=Chitinasiproducens palmae TaxID=1770053 RepID=A0A1H2PUQ7_9BURK|nr:ABC transporter ATP-binding protein [Chitinasiproducens palmae]SDV50579.1 amino acid/amide ABC transporter ATP-binding protein 1, HAAT family [Chitinasiproducens palmae]